MLNPNFIKRIRAAVETIVEAGDGDAKDAALDALAEMYAEGCVSESATKAKRWPLYQWLVDGSEAPAHVVRVMVQRDYLVTLDPTAAADVAAMGDVLSTDLWLEGATKKLSDSAQNRIRSEITAHYNEAYEAQVDEGHSAVAAHIEALKRLGKPKAAAKMFGRTYLTSKEQGFLEYMIHPAKFQNKSYKRYSRIQWLSCLFGAYFQISLDGPLLVAGIATFLCIFKFLVPRLIRDNRPKRAYAWFTTSSIFVLIVIFDYLTTYESDAMTLSFITLYIILAMWYAYSISFLFRKEVALDDIESPSPPALQ